MGFRPTDEQTMLRQSARAFLAEASPASRVRGAMVSELGHDAELWRAVAALGWPGLVLPVEHGGSGLSPVELVFLMEELGRVLAPVPLLSTVLAGWCILEGGRESLREHLLPALAAGREIATVAFTAGAEQEARVVVTPTPDAAMRRLDGRVMLVPDAAAADWFVVAAADRDALGVWIVDRRAGGVTVAPLETVDMTRRFADVRLDGVVVSAENRLEGGDALVSTALDLARVALAAEMVGAASRLIEMSVEYAKTRVQFDVPIGSFQAIQHRLVGMAVETEAARSLVYYAACCLAERPSEAPVAAAMAKAAAAESYSRVAGDAIQVHGGIGFTWEHDLHLYLKRAKADEVLYGDADASRERVARALEAGFADAVPSPQL